MAAIGPWGTFIHIPKTGGQWVSKVLHQLDPGYRSGYGHDLPDDWTKPPIWTVVREPASWLGSIWAHRVRESWHMYPHKVPWQRFCQMTELLSSKDFEQFVENVTTKVPGILTWMLKAYIPPPVRTIRFGEETYHFLESLGCNPYEQKVINKGWNSPEVTQEIRDKVWQVEKEAYGRYGFTHKGEYMWKIGE
jgi:hypothetical protein